MIKMKIGIDISQLIYGGGVAVYTDNLIKNLLAVDKENDYTFFFSALRKDLNPSLASELPNLKKFKLPQTVLDFLWNKLHLLPIEYLLGEIDVFHASDWTQPPRKKAKTVTTIHDLSFLRWPNTVDPLVYQVQKRRLERVKKEADAIIAVSEATKKEIMELLQIPEEKITVIHEALPQDISQDDRRPLSNKLANRLGIDKPYLIAYGSRAPRKNIKRVISAFKSLRNKLNYQLVIIGGYKGKSVLPKGVIVPGFLPRKQMINLLANAKALVFPSLYEGFGLIILEAFILSVPVLTSNVSSMPEVAGNAALLVDPYSEAEIAKAMEKICTDSELRKKLRKRGRERLKAFSWKRAARQTLKVYQKVLQK